MKLTAKVADGTGVGEGTVEGITEGTANKDETERLDWA